MKVVILGAGGQVGRPLLATAPGGLRVVAWSRRDADLERMPATLARLDAEAPDVVINAAAYTAVDRAEAEPDRARAINSSAPADLANWCRRAGSLLVHYSTDYVFDGTGDRDWAENDVAHPLSVYGATKHEGENAILASGADALILRTSWVFAPLGTNFVRTMLRLAREREELSVVDDQWGRPTLADDLAQATWRALETLGSGSEGVKKLGVYHVSGGGDATTWKRFAETIFSEARDLRVPLKIQRVHSTSTAEFNAPAPRPLNSRLNCEKFSRAFGFEFPPWKQSLRRALKAIVAAEATGSMNSTEPS